MTVYRLNERFERIERAYRAALGDRDPQAVSIRDLLPEIFVAVPDSSVEEVVAALRWSARRDLREADKLDAWWRGRDDPEAAQ